MASKGNTTNREAGEDLLDAAQYGIVNKVLSALSKGADIEYTDKCGWTALHFSAVRGHLDTISVLLDRRADILAKDHDSWTALHHATSAGHIEAVKLLLDRGNPISVTDENMWTCLHLCGRFGLVNIAKFLVERGADIGALDKDGRTALHLACHYVRCAIACWLLECGSDPKSLDYFGKSAMDYANEHSEDMAAFLDMIPKYDASITPVDQNQLTSENKSFDKTAEPSCSAPLEFRPADEEAVQNIEPYQSDSSAQNGNSSAESLDMLAVPLFKAQALFAYKADRPSRVDLAAGEIVSVFRDQGNWWLVTNSKSVTGLAPSNFLRNYQPQDNASIQDITPQIKTVKKAEENPEVEITSSKEMTFAMNSASTPATTSIQVAGIIGKKVEQPTDKSQQKWKPDRPPRPSAPVPEFPSGSPTSTDKSNEQEATASSSARRPIPDLSAASASFISSCLSGLPTFLQSFHFADSTSLPVIESRIASEFTSALEHILKSHLAPPKEAPVMYNNSANTNSSAMMNKPPTKGRDLLANTIQKVWKGHCARRQFVSSLKRLRLRRKCVQEILDTERVYVQQLTMLQNCFALPFRKYWAEKLASSSPTPSPLQSSNQLFAALPTNANKIDPALDTAMSTIELILNVNRELLKNLEQTLQGDPAEILFSDTTASESLLKRLNGIPIRKYHAAQTNLGKIFLDLAPFFRLYISFVNNYDLAQRQVEKMMERDQAFAKLMVKCAVKSSLMTTQGGSSAEPAAAFRYLMSLLIAPVQRIPRYALLLRELVRHTPPAHPDKPTLELALSKIENVAADLNERKRDEENKALVRSVSNRLADKVEGLLAPHRKFIREGCALSDSESYCQIGKKREISSNLHETYLFLFNDLIVIASPPRLAVNAAKAQIVKYITGASNLRFREKLNLSRTIVAREPPVYTSLYGMTITMSGRHPDSFFFPSEEERDGWVSDIEHAIKQLKIKRSTLLLDNQLFDPWALDRALNADFEDTETGTHVLAEKMMQTDSAYQSANSRNVGSENDLVSPAKHSASSTDAVDRVRVENELNNHGDYQDNANHAQNINEKQNAAVQSNEDHTEHSALREVLPLYSEAAWLLKELFEIPIELQKLIPEYFARLPPGWIQQLQSRLEQLKRRIYDLGTIHHRCVEVIKDDLTADTLNNAIYRGKPVIQNLYLWVLALPKDTNSLSDTLFTTKLSEANDLTKSLLVWYNSLLEIWNEIVKLPAR